MRRRVAFLPFLPPSFLPFSPLFFLLFYFMSKDVKGGGSPPFFPSLSFSSKIQTMGAEQTVPPSLFLLFPLLFDEGGKVRMDLGMGKHPTFPLSFFLLYRG